MSKTAVEQWSTTAGSNTDVAGVDIDENCAMAGMNNSQRAIMAQIAVARADNQLGYKAVVNFASDDTLVAAHRGDLVRATGAATFGTTAAATLGAGWHCWVRGAGGAAIIDPNGAETIDGVSTLTVPNGQTALVVCDGSNFFSTGVGFMSNLVDDTPQLGAALDGQGFDLNNLGVIFLTEQAEAETNVAGKGQLWVDTATPNVLYFTDDADTDFKVVVPTDVLGQETIWIPAGAMEARVTTAPATSNAVEIGTSLIALRTMDFATDADDFAGFAFQMPKSWDESTTVVAQFTWSHAATTTNFGVTWGISAVAYTNGDLLSTARAAGDGIGTAVVVDDTGGTTNDLYTSAETAAITINNLVATSAPGAEEWVYFEVYRDVSDAQDDMAIDARLHGVKIHYTTAALNDS